MQKSSLLTSVFATALCASGVAAQDAQLDSEVLPGFTQFVESTPLRGLAAEGDANAFYSAAAPYYITSVAFDDIYDSRISNGPIPAPVLLLTDGISTYNADVVTTPIDIDYDRVEHPEAWPAWRRSNGAVQIQGQNGWQQVYYQYEVAALASGTRLSGTFEHRRDATAGTTAASSADYRFRFYTDGTYESCKSTLVVVPAIPSIKREYSRISGRYMVDGYTLTITNDADSTTATAPLFFDPQRPTRMWMGSNHYPQPSDNLTDICRKL